MIVPPIRVQLSAIEMERIEDAVLGLGPFAHNEQSYFGLGVVEEAVREPCTGRKPDGIAWLQPMEMTVQPDIGLAFDDVDEFFVRAFGVWKGSASAGRQSFVMDAELPQSEIPAERRADAHELVIFIIMRVVRLLDLTPMKDAGWTFWRRHGYPPELRVRIAHDSASFSTRCEH
jgi:hypothetical protein